MLQCSYSEVLLVILVAKMHHSLVSKMTSRIAAGACMVAKIQSWRGLDANLRLRSRHTQSLNLTLKYIFMYSEHRLSTPRHWGRQLSSIQQRRILFTTEGSDVPTLIYNGTVTYILLSSLVGGTITSRLSLFDFGNTHHALDL